MNPVQTSFSTEASAPATTEYRISRDVSDRQTQTREGTEFGAMRLSRDKIMHLSHLIVQTLEDQKLVKLLKEHHSLRMEIANTMLEELSIEEEVEKEVQRILRSYKRKIIEGSREWDVMYRKTFEEQMKKRGRIS